MHKNISMNKSIITDAFINEAAEVLGETDCGLTGSEICKHSTFYATEYNRNIPYTEDPFKDNNGNNIKKSKALKQNLQCFSAEEQYIIISKLCEIGKFSNNERVKELKGKLFRDYSCLAPSGEIEKEFIEETSHWLKNYPDTLQHYNEAYRKYKSQDEQLYRNTLDDARIALEMFLRAILKNDKSLENQQKELGKFICGKGGSTEFSIMFWQLLNYYSKYQNNRVKHKDNVVKIEIPFIFELTTLFMRQLVRFTS